MASDLAVCLPLGKSNLTNMFGTWSSAFEHCKLYSDSEHAAHTSVSFEAGSGGSIESANRQKGSRPRRRNNCACFGGRQAACLFEFGTRRPSRVCQIACRTATPRRKNEARGPCVRRQP